MKQIIINIFIFSILLSCAGKSSNVCQKKTSESDSTYLSTQLVNEFYLDTNKTAKLEIYRNETDNYILPKYMTKN
jgi:hypothetical protein